jgi:hypothetical protein
MVTFVAAPAYPRRHDRRAWGRANAPLTDCCVVSMAATARGRFDDAGGTLYDHGRRMSAVSQRQSLSAITMGGLCFDRSHFKRNIVATVDGTLPPPLAMMAKTICPQRVIVSIAA